MLGRDRAIYAGQRVLVIGGGHSAANVLLDLARLAEADAGLQIIWAVRSANLARVFGGGAADKLPARGKLGDDLEAARRQRTAATRHWASRSNGSSDAATALVVIGRATAAMAARLARSTASSSAPASVPILSMTRELRLDLDPWLESARALGPMIDPNLHSCGSVPPHGYKQLAHPEPGYFAVGIKSYGRAPTFLMATGYEQVRSVAAHLAGDDAAANDVRLVLPETGVCSTDLAPSIAASEGCCGGPAPADVGRLLRGRCYGEGERRGRLRLRPQRKPNRSVATIMLREHAQCLIASTTCCFSAPAIRRARSLPKRS